MSAGLGFVHTVNGREPIQQKRSGSRWSHSFPGDTCRVDANAIGIRRHVVLDAAAFHGDGNSNIVPMDTRRGFVAGIAQDGTFVIC